MLTAKWVGHWSERPSPDAELGDAKNGEGPAWLTTRRIIWHVKRQRFAWMLFEIGPMMKKR